MRKFRPFPIIRQYDSADCALACLRMICKYYQKSDCFDENIYQYYISKDGISLASVVDIAKQENFNVVCGKLSLQGLIDEALLPCILFWDSNHFIILYDVQNTKTNIFFKVVDPAKGRQKYSLDEFKSHWLTVADKDDEQTGIAILLEPDDTSEIVSGAKIKDERKSFIPILFQYKKMLLFILLGIIIGAVIQLIFPYLTQSIVDSGIEKRDVGFIFTILLGQMALITGSMFNDFFRRNIVLRLGSNFSIKLLTDLVAKLLQLPIRFFDSKQISDFIQRLQDHDKIERFMTTYFVNCIFSVVTLVVMGVVLIMYSRLVFLVFSIGSLVYILWTLNFVNKRKKINYSLFSINSKNQGKYYEIIKGISEIKLQNSMHENKEAIGDIQKELYKVNLDALKIDQYIDAGNVFINELKNILITFLSAYLVIKGEFTLGIMMSIQYIIGELNVPISQFITFINGFQDAKLSLDRMNSIFAIRNDEDGSMRIANFNSGYITLHRLRFKYLMSGNDVLNDVSLKIPLGKTIAIVGASGSGKTTFVKLLLKLYKPTTGEIKISGVSLSDVENHFWRENCGAVLQDGYIFSATIKKNIIMSKPYNDTDFQHAIYIANIDTFVENFANKYETKIGENGINLSQGQKQRILIARAVYKNPKIVFFDEATNSLDANNERIILKRLYSFLKGKTTFIVAHRLSTVRNADIILVMDQGKIIEQGTHDTLIDSRGYYYRLVKNQLELSE